MSKRPQDPTQMKLLASWERKEETAAAEQAEAEGPTEEETVAEVARVGLRGQPALVKRLWVLFAQTRSYGVARGMIGYGYGVQLDAAKALRAAQRRVEKAETEEEAKLAAVQFEAAVAAAAQAHRFRRGACELAEAYRKNIKCEGVGTGPMPDLLRLLFEVGGEVDLEDFTASNLPPEA